MIDSHCHFDFSIFTDHQQSMWVNCQSAGLTHLIIPAVNPDDLQGAILLSETLLGIYFSVGLHPCWVNDFFQVHGDNAQVHLLVLLQKHIKNPRCVAIGELGLDLSIACTQAQQLCLLEVQLQLAKEASLPVIVHQRKSHNELLRLLKLYQLPAGGVIHGFSGSFQQAKAYWDLGFYLGVGGVITYARAIKTRKAIKAMPLEALLLETDAPDMPLQGLQGQANSPVHLPLIAACLAKLKNMDEEIVLAQTQNNTRKLFTRMSVNE